MSAAKVAVVILSWNGVDFLKQFLPSVVASTYSNLDIYVIDNASTDSSIPYLKENFPKVKIIALESNLGFTGGYNAGLKQIESDYYVLLNQDVEVTPEWVQPVIDLMETDQSVGACQPKIKAYHQKSHFEYAGAGGGFIDQYGYPFCRGRIFDTVEEDKGQYDTNIPIFWATGACLFIRSKLYHELGGLDEALFAHMEEIDLCWRLQNIGHKIMYCKDSTVYHVGGGSLPQGNPRKTYLNFRNNLIIMSKNIKGLGKVRLLIIRLALDHIAAYRALFSGDIKTYLAIAKAHLHFILGSFTRKSTKFPKRKFYSLAEVYQSSIVLDYFLRKRKVFSELKWLGNHVQPLLAGEEFMLNKKN